MINAETNLCILYSAKTKKILYFHNYLHDSYINNLIKMKPSLFFRTKFTVKKILDQVSSQAKIISCASQKLVSSIFLNFHLVKFVELYSIIVSVMRIVFHLTYILLILPSSPHKKVTKPCGDPCRFLTPSPTSYPSPEGF